MDMVHRDQGYSPAPRNRLRGLDAHEQGAYETWPDGDCHGRQLPKRDPTLPARLGDHGSQPLHVGATRDLRDHAAIPLMNRILRVNDGGEDLPFAGENRGARVVARGFDSKKRGSSRKDRRTGTSGRGHCSLNAPHRGSPGS